MHQLGRLGHYIGVCSFRFLVIFYITPAGVCCDKLKNIAWNNGVKLRKLLVGTSGVQVEHITLYF